MATLFQSTSLDEHQTQRSLLQSAQQAMAASGAGGIDTCFAAARDALLQVCSAEQLASADCMLS